MLDIYGQHKVIELQLSISQRVEYHQSHSLPILEKIKHWGENHIANESIEENSSLGKAIGYFLKRYVGLSLFCHHERIKLDNNRIEAMLKVVVRDKKCDVS